MQEQHVSTTKYLRDIAAPTTVGLEALSQSLTSQASRFRKPWPFQERVLLMLSQLGLRLGPVSDVELPFASSVPPHWQPIFNVLYRAGLVEHAGFDVPSFRTDMPKALSITIKGSIRQASDHGRVLGHASGRDPEETISKALGEFLERYSATIVDANRCTRASIMELEQRGTRFLDPRTLCQFSADQRERFEQFRYDAETPLHWTRCMELLLGKSHLMPAQLAQYPFRSHVPDEPVLNPLTSNGMAGHFSRDEAILAGLKELIQRDAFLIYWLNTLTPRRIDVSGITNPQFQRLLAYVRAYRTDLYFLDLETDLPVPTAVCIAIARTKDGPIITVGAGNGSTALEALERACFEAIPALSLSAAPLAFDPAAADYLPFSRPEIGKLERITLWRGHDWLKRLGFWLDGPLEPFDAFAEQFQSYASPAAELHALKEMFRHLGKGYEIYVHTLRNPIIDALGYHVVHVRVPKLVPMYLYEHQAALDAERLTSVPATLGLPVRGRNVYPHPFP